MCLGGGSPKPASPGQPPQQPQVQPTPVVNEADKNKKRTGYGNPNSTLLTGPAGALTPMGNLAKTTLLGG